MDISGWCLVSGPRIILDTFVGKTSVWNKC
jgi:hypothetical protein